MTTETHVKPMRLTIGQDQDCENPNEYGLFRLVSFNNSHRPFQAPDEILFVVDYDEEDDDGYPLRIPNPDVLFNLSYYEHGLCRWMVGDSTVPDYGGFDTVDFAGVLVWNGADDEREWWDNRPDEDKREAADLFAQEYTNWSNGECYWFALETLDHCESCGQETGTKQDEPSCGGIIGRDWLRETIKEDTGLDMDDLPEHVELKEVWG